MKSFNIEFLIINLNKINNLGFEMGDEKAKPAKELSKELKFRISKKPLIVGGIIATIAIAGIVTGIYFWSKLLPTRH
ncbi:MAG: hypothetical protein ACFFBW_11915 [Promethearchaeota archaeon]